MLTLRERFKIKTPPSFGKKLPRVRNTCSDCPERQMTDLYTQYLRQPDDPMRSVIRVKGSNDGTGFRVYAESVKLSRHLKKDALIAFVSFETEIRAREYANSVIEECVTAGGFIRCS